MIRATTRRGRIEAVRRELRRLFSDPQAKGYRQLRERFGEELCLIVQSEYLRKAKGYTDDAGIRWEPTQRYRTTRQPMLIKTMALFDHIQSRLLPNGQISIYVDPKIDYAGYLHNGTRNMPARPFWPKNIPVRWINRALLAILPDLQRYLQDAVT